MYEFECPTPITVSLHLGSGSADITAEDRTTVQVEVLPFHNTQAGRDAVEATRVELRGDELVVDGPRPRFGGWLGLRSGWLRIQVRVPLGTGLVAKTGPADLYTHGRLGDLSLTQTSGDARIDMIGGNADITTASGDVEVDAVDGSLRVTSMSGDVRVGHVRRELTAHAASGDLTIARAGDAVTTVTASGDVTLDVADHGEIGMRTASGDVKIGVATGTGVWLDLSATTGDVRSDLDMPATEEPVGVEAAALKLRVRAMSGDIRIRRTAPALPALNR
jgi:hypothetical protein